MQNSNANLNLPACLIIMDGFGLRDEARGNAIKEANTPVFDKLWEGSPHVKLQASGRCVGLPDGQMGNSEVGHLNIGAGRVVNQELTRINNACEDGSIQDNVELNRAFDHCKANKTRLHLLGLVSDGGVHSSIEHLFAIIDAAIKSRVQTIRIHCFMDGRDVSPTSGVTYIESLEKKVAAAKAENPELNIKIGSICGRYYAMDRDNRWDRVERAYETIVDAENLTRHTTPIEYVEASYEKGITDEFIEPAAFCSKGIREGDACIFFNFRPDRARELTRAIALSNFDAFGRVQVDNLYFVCLTCYDETFALPIAFPKTYPDNVLADAISQANLRQFHIAETEKYAHVTFFFNGGIEEPKEGESRVLIPSPKVASYDMKPEMSAFEVTERLVEAIDNNEADFYIVNFANCDMVGHTGDESAAIKAVEVVDECVGLVLSAIERKSGFALLTADHGNADKMISEDGSPHTAHTTSLVPLVLIDHSGLNTTFQDGDCIGSLCDIAPTMLALVGLDIPKQMTGKNLAS